MDGRESTSRSILHKVGLAPTIRRRGSDTEETNDCDQEVRAINTQRSNMNMKQEAPFLGEKSNSNKNEKSPKVSISLAIFKTLNWLFGLAFEVYDDPTTFFVSKS